MEASNFDGAKNRNPFRAGTSEWKPLISTEPKIGTPFELAEPCLTNQGGFQARGDQISGGTRHMVCTKRDRGNSLERAMAYAIYIYQYQLRDALREIMSYILCMCTVWTWDIPWPPYRPPYHSVAALCISWCVHLPSNVFWPFFT